MGHTEKFYRNKGKQRPNQPQQTRAKARVAEEGSDQEEQVFAASCSVAKRKATKGWLIDSGCTNHMTPNTAIFKKIDRKFKTRVNVGNGHFIKAEGKGDVLIDTHTGTKLVSNVLLVPEIDGNLLSIAQLLEKGYSVVFKGKECLISDLNGSKLMSVIMANKSFIVDWSKGSDSAYTAIQYESKLWYKRPSHKFKAAAETETSCKLKTLRFDNGTEYTSSEFQKFCDETGIKHQLTNTYTPQQNGVSERKNRSLMDMARCLMFERNLPKTFWAEAVNTAVYLQNRLPTKALAQKTLFEAWFGFKPSLAHLRVFGCICYAHIHIVKRDKLAKKAQPGILVGYSSVKKGYRILDPLSNKVLMSRDVVFDEKSS
ncbi:hypothetical protein CXB51_016967 [Gossypium anomalum]|uniref:Integrase catalytic domain-containing protein n=1 Tax=Gossypium anomalum TaxID=47600 RepID=A0A8J6CY75_9ROSI|nr:hypothetical protein CXB51_016967 [Gossypium anomalum]